MTDWSAVHVEGVRWWDVIVGSGLAFFAVLAVMLESSGWSVAAALGGLVVIGVAYLLLGRPALLDRLPGWPFLVLGTLGTMVAATGAGALAAVQAIVVPLVWMTAGTYRRAVAGNVVVAGAVLVALLFASSRSQWGAVALVQGLTLVFGVAIGTWMTRVGELSDARKVLIEQLEATRSEVESLSHERGAAAERERIARDLHDTIAQDLTALVMLAQRGRRGDEPAARLASIEEIAAASLAELRALVAAEAGLPLDGGLAAALRRLGARFEHETGVPVEVDADDRSVPVDAEVVLLRVAQEGLANVRKHAGASSARLVLRGGAAARLQVCDDGHGFEPDRAPRGFGLLGMRERIEAAGGSLQIDSSCTGTTLTAALGAGVAR